MILTILLSKGAPAVATPQAAEGQTFAKRCANGPNLAAPGIWAGVPRRNISPDSSSERRLFRRTQILTAPPSIRPTPDIQIDRPNANFEKYWNDPRNPTDPSMRNNRQTPPILAADATGLKRRQAVLKWLRNRLGFTRRIKARHFENAGLF